MHEIKGDSMDMNKNKDNRQKVTVAILTRNEEKTIGKVIDGCRRFADELIVVDGHSKDSTREVARERGVKVIMDNGKGKGDGIKTAINNIEEGIIVLIDADGSHLPEDIPRLVKPIQDGISEHVHGSRILGGSEEFNGSFLEIMRLLGGNIITLAINYKLNVRLTDSQNGFRAISAALAKKLDLKEEITTIEQEMVIKTIKMGYKIFEVPAHEYKRLYGNSVIKLRKVWLRYVYTCLKYLFFK
ncbi:glycosyltransferase family 2 protein [Candidatus Omnitrophota bacterium]